MFELWETNRPARKIAETRTFDEALDLLDGACEARYRAVAANGEGASQMRFYFEIREGTKVKAMLSWRPEPELPFSSVATVMRSFDDLS